MKTMNKNAAEIANSSRPYVVVYEYATDAHERGEILSTHSTHELAEKAANKSGYSTFLAVKDARDYV